MDHVHKTVQLVDEFTFFAGRGGRWVASLAALCGNLVAVNSDSALSYISSSPESSLFWRPNRITSDYNITNRKFNNYDNPIKPTEDNTNSLLPLQCILHGNKVHHQIGVLYSVLRIEVTRYRVRELSLDHIVGWMVIVTYLVLCRSLCLEKALTLASVYSPSMASLAEVWAAWLPTTARWISICTYMYMYNTCKWSINLILYLGKL